MSTDIEVIKLAKSIDHTLLKADATQNDMIQLCHQAIAHQFRGVCVSSAHVSQCSEILKDSSIKSISVVGFPLGNQSISTKIHEAVSSIQQGADELDMVMSIGTFKDKKYNEVQSEIERVIKETGTSKVKVIIETCLLDDDEIVDAAKLIEQSGAYCVKTSTGFSTSGATIENVRTIRQAVSPHMKVKASGGIKTYTDAWRFLESGADYLGTSRGPQIINSVKSE